jgi:ligand-binding sensor domain-containing protein
MISSVYIRSVVACATLAFVCFTNLTGQRQTFRQYGSQEGLTNLTVSDVLQDRTGFIWVGTENGLFRYDGGSFRHFGHEDGLPSTEVRGLAQAPDGSLWVATSDGVARGSARGFKLVATGTAESAGTVAFDGMGRAYLTYPFGIVRGVPNGAGSYLFHTVVSGTSYGLSVDGEDVWFVKNGDVWRLSLRISWSEWARPTGCRPTLGGLS